MIPETEFRLLPVAGDEPADCTTAGVSLGNGGLLDLGSVDTTDEARDTPVTVLCWRVTDMNGASEIRNIRVWLDGAELFEGASQWYMDITDEWTGGKTVIDVREGNPGAAPLAEPPANLTKAGGGAITGTTADQASQYIYIAGTVAVNETTGAKEGPVLSVRYDYK